MDEATIKYILGRLQETESGCKEWPGAYGRSDYGHVIRQGRLYDIHRVLFEHFRGPIPEGMVLDHLCRNRRCGNVAHLEVVDTRTNTLRGNGCFARCARATHCPRGHEYAGENLYIRDGKYRGCRACDKIRRAAARERLRERRRTGRIYHKAPKKERPPGKAKGVANTIDDLLYRLIIREDGCWEYPGKPSKKGYMSANCEGRAGKVHRHVYEHFRGPVPAGLVLDHLCRFPACANPDHLEAVTHRENILRGQGLAAQQVTRTACPRGHPYSGANLRINKKGSRYCRQCSLDRGREQYRQIKAARQERLSEPSP